VAALVLLRMGLAVWPVRHQYCWLGFLGNIRCFLLLRAPSVLAWVTPELEVKLGSDCKTFIGCAGNAGLGLLSVENLRVSWPLARVWEPGFPEVLLGGPQEPPSSMMIA
jgi:hypothetical protein